MKVNIGRNMVSISEMELKDARTAITSLMYKCEKAKDKLKGNPSQHTLLEGRIKALKISVNLIEEEILKMASD